MKICTTHNIEMHFKSNKWRCLSCNAETKKKWYNKNKETQINRVYLNKIKIQSKILDYLKDNPCVDCKESNLIVLEFDHISDKKHNISNMVQRGNSWDTILKEIEKCEVRCANCHRIKTARESNNYKWQYTVSLA